MYRLKFQFLTVVMIMGFFSSCKGQKVQSGSYNMMLKTLLSHNVDEVSVQQADSLKKESEDVVFIDTRERKEYEVSHIENAVWVGYDDFKMDRMQDVPKDKKVIVYCSVGARSEKITEKLLGSGYKDVSNLYGGIFEWANQDKEVVDSTGTTNKIHAYNKVWGVWLKRGEKVYD